jgi:hypothetical protein
MRTPRFFGHLNFIGLFLSRLQTTVLTNQHRVSPWSRIDVKASDHRITQERTRSTADLGWLALYSVSICRSDIIETRARRLPVL